MRPFETTAGRVKTKAYASRRAEFGLQRMEKKKGKLKEKEKALRRRGCMEGKKRRAKKAS